MVIHEQQIIELENYYNELDMGIILVDITLDLIFINSWFRKRLPEDFRNLWETGKSFNIKKLYTSCHADFRNIEKIQRIIEKVLKDKSVMVLSQAFHKWIIPLDDKRFPDGKMRQTCIAQPYSYFKNMVLVQIKDESDTVLKSENLRKSREEIKDKNRELQEANHRLEQLNSDLVRLNRELTEREKYAKQKSKMEAIGRMAGGIAHDFNNYLFIILGNTEFLMNNIPTNDIHYGCLGDIEEAANNAKNIIGEIATFRRSDMEDYTQYKEARNLNIDTVIRAQISLVKAMLPKSIEVDYSHRDRTNSVVRANSSEIQRILFNLVINSAHAILGNSCDLAKNVETSKKPIIVGTIHIIVKSAIVGDGASEAAIYQALKQSEEEDLILKGENIVNQYDSIKPGKYVAITIHDSGNGISPDNLEKIFDPYFTTKPAGQGSGIGLSVVHGIVKHLKGAIHVQSEVNKGTAFTVLLPDVGML
ncbi:MAG: hypothetical protein HQK73_10545 [Desulfamplus sp.]|nr:hypothetical protein [Desulfamplus sp.]MBF0414031.1 hypothetical protein [Desulfamplus sp.]